MAHVVQIVIDDSTNKVVTGVYDFDRDGGGTLIIPAGTSFPGSPVAGELFWRTDENKLYRRNNINDAWVSVAASVAAHATSHQHGGSDEVATATAAANAIPKAGAGAKLDVAWLPTGSTGTTVCIGNDARLSDARTPTAHASSHNAGGSDALAIDAAAGTGSLRTLGTSATSACAGNDARLSDARTPTSHASTHNAGGGDALAIDAAAGTGSLRTLGTSATSACAGNDARLSDARTPTAHASTHNAGGSDALAIDAAAGTGSLRTLGTSATSACAGNDGRLSDARTPTSHASSHNAGGGDALAIDAAAGTGSLRTLGTAATAACAGNDSRLSDARTPTGTASGDLGGTYPSPTVVDLTISGEAQGDILYRNATNWVRLAAGTAGQVLQTQGVGANPQWATGGGGAHAPTHIHHGSDEIQADLVSMDYIPANYTRKTDATATDNQHLRAHLAGIDRKLAPRSAETITFVASTTQVNGAAGTSLVTNVPAGVRDGDLLIAVIGFQNSTTGTWTPPAGWTSVIENQLASSSGVADTAPRVSVFLRVADNEPASYTWTASTSDGLSGFCLAYRGEDLTTPQDATRTVAIGAALGAPNPASITTVTNGAVVVAIGWADDDTGFSGLSSGYTSRIASTTQAPIGVGNGATYAICDLTVATAGATDPGAFTTTDPEQWGAITLAIRPAVYGDTNLVGSGVSEAESSTTSGTYQNKLTVTPTFTSGVLYRIDYQFELGASADSDANARVQVGGTTVAEMVFRNYPYAARYELQSGFYFASNLSGATAITVDYNMGYGGTAYIRRARVMATRV